MIFDFHIRPYYFHLLDNKCLTVYIVNDLSNKFHCTEIDTCSLLPHNEVRHLPLLSVHQFALVVLGAIIAQLIQYHVRYVWFKSCPPLRRVTPGFSQLKKPTPSQTTIHNNIPQRSTTNTQYAKWSGDLVYLSHNQNATVELFHSNHQDGATFTRIQNRAGGSNGFSFQI